MAIDDTPTIDQQPLGPTVTLTTYELRELALAAGVNRAEGIDDDQVGLYLARAAAADAACRDRIAFLLNELEKLLGARKANEEIVEPTADAVPLVGGGMPILPSGCLA